jgi:hypothetical protein
MRSPAEFDLALKSLDALNQFPQQKRQIGFQARVRDKIP